MRFTSIFFLYAFLYVRLFCDASVAEKDLLYENEISELRKSNAQLKQDLLDQNARFKQDLLDLKASFADEVRKLRDESSRLKGQLESVTKTKDIQRDNGFHIFEERLNLIEQSCKAKSVFSERKRRGESLDTLKDKKANPNLNYEGKIRRKSRKLHDTFGQVKRNAAGEANVAFFASLSVNKLHLYPEQDIVFDYKSLDIGNAYLNGHGTFVAPVRGVYVFSTSLLSTWNKTDAKIVKNGHEILAMMDCDKWTQASQTVIAQLESGDDVSVKIHFWQNIELYGNKFCTFCGFLLYELPAIPVAVGK